MSRFRRNQVLCDLLAVARRATQDSLIAIAAHVPSVRQSFDSRLSDLRRAIATGALAGAHADDLLTCLRMAATLPRQDALAFETATALLLADLVLEGEGDEGMFWHWDAFSDHYRAADDPVRAALMQGFAWCSDAGRTTLESPPGPDDLTTWDREMVVAELLQFLARTYPRGAGALRGAGGNEAAALLRDAAGDEDTDGSLAKSAPGVARAILHALEVAAETPEHPAHDAAVALLCLNALQDDSATARLGDWWAGPGQARDDLPAPLAAGLRYVYETHPDWDPYAGWTSARARSEGRCLPWGGAC